MNIIKIADCRSIFTKVVKVHSKGKKTGPEVTSSKHKQNIKLNKHNILAYWAPWIQDTTIMKMP